MKQIGRPAIPKKMWLNRLYRGASRAKKVAKKGVAKSPISRRKSGVSKSPISRRKSGWPGRPGRAARIENTHSKKRTRVASALFRGTFSPRTGIYINERYVQII